MNCLGIQLNNLKKIFVPSNGEYRGHVSCEPNSMSVLPNFFLASNYKMYMVTKLFILVWHIALGICALKNSKLLAANTG